MIRYKADSNHDFIEYRIRYKVRTDVNPFFYYIFIKPFKLIFNLIIKPFLPKTQTIKSLTYMVKDVKYWQSYKNEYIYVCVKSN